MFNYCCHVKLFLQHHHHHKLPPCFIIVSLAILKHNEMKLRLKWPPSGCVSVRRLFKTIHTRNCELSMFSYPRRALRTWARQQASVHPRVLRERGEEKSEAIIRAWKSIRVYRGKNRAAGLLRQLLIHPDNWETHSILALGEETIKPTPPLISEIAICTRNELVMLLYAFDIYPYSHAHAWR